jgi:preprotein translocase subunit SecA
MARQIYNVTLTTQATRQEVPQNVTESGPEETAGVASGSADTATTEKPQKAAAAGTAVAESPAQGNGAAMNRKVGRNDPCPCGSGKKYKKCHGAGGLASVG